MRSAHYYNRSLLDKFFRLKGVYSDTTPLNIELSWQSVYSDADATQLNSTSSCRHVHSVNSCHLSMNVVTQLTQFVGRDVINKNTTDLAVRCSTRCRVELCRYKHPFRITSYLQTLCSQIGMSVLYSFCLLFCVHDYFKSNVSI